MGIYDFKDKVAIVTGGASGLGRALCEELGRRGAAVIVTDIDREGAEQVSLTITTADGRARAAQIDVAEAKDVQRIIKEAASEHGRLDYIFNNAGIAIGGEVRDMSLDHWRRIVDVNLFGVLYGTTEAYSLMARQGFGHIVNIASLSGLVGLPISTPYAMTKHAVVGLSTSLRAEGSDLGVKVSVVCPGYIHTGIHDASPVVKAEREEVNAMLPWDKMMDAKKAAGLILRDVLRNRAIIIFPFRSRLLWRLFRIHPAIFNPIWSKIVRGFRVLRSES